MKLDQLEREYDPQNDVPQGVQVTWADYALLLAVKDLQEADYTLLLAVKDLQERIAVLEADKQWRATKIL